MFRLFHFGNFHLCVQGSSTLLNILPFWEEETKISSIPFPKNSLILEETQICTLNDIANGWNAESLGEMQQVTYTMNHKVLFVLQYRSPVIDVKILLPILSNGNGIRPGLQFGMLIALYQSCVGLHGVTLLCKDEIIILSAPSGTGKTTLARLLETYCDALVINGDFAMLSLCKEGVIFEPTPFCGSSGRCLNHRVRIDRIVFLEQAKDNCWQDLTGTSALVKLLSNSFVPTWDSTLQKSIQENLIRFLPHLKINRFAFAPVQEAAEMFYSKLTSKQ